VGEIPLDARRLVWGPGAGVLAVIRWEKPVAFLDAGTFEPLPRKSLTADGVTEFDASRDGKAVAWCQNSTWFSVKHLNTSKSVEVESGNGRPRPVFSPDGRVVATGGFGKEAKVWDAVTGELKWELTARGEGELIPVFSADGKWLAVGNRNHATRVYEAASGKLVHTFQTGRTHDLRFDPAGRILAATDVGGMVFTWSIPDGKTRHARRSGAAELYTLDWSPAGDVLATAGRSGKLTLWDPRNLTVLQEYEVPDWVGCVRFSPDGSRLLTVGGAGERSPDCKITVWGPVR
jgi:YD repeat-containing protein